MAEKNVQERLKAAERILVPVDLSPLSYQALDLALSMAGPKTRVRLFYASSPVYSYVQGSGGTDMVVTQVYDRKLSVAHLEQAKKEMGRRIEVLKGGVEVYAFESGQPAPAIALAARRFGADRVVMTTHGRGGLSKLLSGSVAQKLFHLYSGPIVLLRPQRSKKKA